MHSALEGGTEREIERDGRVREGGCVSMKRGLVQRAWMTAS